MVFAAFTQYCLQSNVTHYTHVEGVEYYVLYSVYSGPLTPSGGKAIWKAFHLVDLAVHHQSVQGGSFVNFLGLVNYKGDCRQDTQPIPNS